MPSAAAGIPLPEIKELLRDIGRWYVSYKIFPKFYWWLVQQGKCRTILKVWEKIVGQ